MTDDEFIKEMERLRSLLRSALPLIEEANKNWKWSAAKSEWYEAYGVWESDTLAALSSEVAGWSNGVTDATGTMQEADYWHSLSMELADTAIAEIEKVEMTDDDLIDKMVNIYWNPPMDNEHHRRMRAALAVARQIIEREALTSISDQLHNLAVALHAKHYQNVTQWKPSDDPQELILQIDNMTAGIEREALEKAANKVESFYFRSADTGAIREPNISEMAYYIRALMEQSK